MKRLGLHITWGTYGTRLHGDPRGTVDRYNNDYGTPVLRYDEHRWEQEKENLKFPPVLLTRPQMIFIEEQLPLICGRGHWNHIIGAAGPDHVHEILESPFDRETIRRLLKRWLGQALSEKWSLPDGATWWAECGSIKRIDNDRYYAIRPRPARNTHIGHSLAKRAPPRPRAGPSRPVLRRRAVRPPRISRKTIGMGSGR